jgi:SAM-dependent methyltransferase
MPANFTRRLDLFRDAGFADPQAAVEAVKALADPDPSPLPPSLARLAALCPEWLFMRQGDLATVLWLAAQEHGGTLPVRAFVQAMLAAFESGGRIAEAQALRRFLADVEFDFGHLYGEKGPAYGFFREREPNPFVFKLLEHFEGRAPGSGDLRILELGAGIGNDAVGFLGSPLVKAYVAVDLSDAQLAKAVARTAGRVRPLTGDFAALLQDPNGHGLGDSNLIYSYSSLHYFNSTELSQILDRAHALLAPGRGHLAFAIKGAGSIWDGQGVPLYRPDVWINLDGQSRWFPSVKALDELMDRHGFATKLHELHEHWGYSEAGKKDLFHYVLAEAVG